MCAVRARNPAPKSAWRSLPSPVSPLPSRTYLDSAEITAEKKDRPLFRLTLGMTKRLTDRPLTTKDLCRMRRRRLKDAGLLAQLSPQSFRVTGITDLLSQGVPADEVQYLAGHSSLRTTKLYDRRQKRK